MELIEDDVYEALVSLVNRSPYEQVKLWNGTHESQCRYCKAWYIYVPAYKHWPAQTTKHNADCIWWVAKNSLEIE